MDVDRVIARNLLSGAKEGVWRTEVPRRDPGGEPREDLRAKPPEAGDTC